jgi:iron-regulated transporter 1
LAVAASCVIFWFLASGWHLSHGLKWGLLALLALLACIEKLTSVMNMVSVENCHDASSAENELLNSALTS